MPNVATLTLTGITGPGQAVTAQVLTGVKGIDFQIGPGIIRITKEDGIQFDVAYVPPTATVTYTISGSTATVAIS